MGFNFSKAVEGGATGAEIAASSENLLAIGLAAGAGALVGGFTGESVMAAGVGDPSTAHGGEWVLDHPYEASQENGDREYPRRAAYWDLFAANPELVWVDSYRVWRAPHPGYPNGGWEIILKDARTGERIDSAGEWDANGYPSDYVQKNGKGFVLWWRWDDWLTVGWPELVKHRGGSMGAPDSSDPNPDPTSGQVFISDDVLGQASETAEIDLNVIDGARMHARIPGAGLSERGQEQDSGRALLWLLALGGLGVWLWKRSKKGGRRA